MQRAGSCSQAALQGAFGADQAAASRSIRMISGLLTSTGILAAGGVAGMKIAGSPGKGRRGPQGWELAKKQGEYNSRPAGRRAIIENGSADIKARRMLAGAFCGR